MYKFIDFSSEQKKLFLHLRIPGLEKKCTKHVSIVSIMIFLWLSILDTELFSVLGNLVRSEKVQEKRIEY